MAGKQTPHVEGPDERQQKLDVLMKEYELAVSRYDTTDNRHIQLLAAFVAVLSVIGAYLAQALRIGQTVTSTTQANVRIPTEFALLAPLLFIMLYAFFVYVMYTSRSHSFICRILSERINNLLKDTALVRFDPDLPPTMFFEPIVPPATKIRLVYLLLFAISFIFFAAVTIAAYLYIHANSYHWLATLFAAFYVAFGLLEIFAFMGVIYDLKGWYVKFEKDVHNVRSGPLSRRYSFRRKYYKGPNSPALRAVINRSSVMACVLPRRREFITRGLIFWAGFIAAIVAVHFQDVQAATANYLFGDIHVPWTVANEVNPWAWLGLGVAYFLVEELLLQQSKYLWDYVRGDDCYTQEQDFRLRRSNEASTKRKLGAASESPKEITRRVTRLYMNNIPPNIARSVLIIRLALAFILGAVLGGPVFLLLLLSITLHQATYVMFIKPHSDKALTYRLLFRSLSLPARFLAGALVVVATPWSYTLLLFLTLVCYAYAIGGAAAHWTMDAVFRNEEPTRIAAVEPSNFLNCQDKITQIELQKASINRQDHYFQSRGKTWRRFGLIVAVLLTTSLILMEVVARFDVLNFSGQIAWYMKYNTASGERQYLNQDSWPWVIALITGVLLFSFVALRVHADPKNVQSQGPTISTTPAANRHNLRKGATIVLFVVGLSLVISSVVWLKVDFLNLDNVLLLLAGFLLINVGRLIRYEGMTYEEYNKDKSDEQVGLVTREWYDYLFDPRPGLSLRDIIWHTAALFW